MKSKKYDAEFLAQIGVIIILMILLVYTLGPSKNFGGIGVVSASSIVPIGTPEIYGEELGIKYDHVSPDNQKLANQAINLLGNIDRVEKLEGEELERYIDILYNMHGGISCEYCCGARSVIFSNGDPACGCAHSYAMRGLTKYLILNHPEISDEEIMTEIGKWKVLFFPGIIEGKAQVMETLGIETDYISLTTNKYRGIEKGQTQGEMIGSC
ncbi:MAG: hypothetical protein WDZ77_02995 [Candidatus Pacearchaeota archaeon]